MNFSDFIKKEESSYNNALEDQLGINPEDQKKDPKIASWISLGLTKNIGLYTIIDYKKNQDGKITHALVRKNNDPSIKSLSYRGDSKVVDTKNQTYLISIEDLENQIMLQGQNQAAPSSGEAGGIVWIFYLLRIGL